MGLTMLAVRRLVGAHLNLAAFGQADSGDTTQLTDADVLPLWNDRWFAKGYLWLYPTTASTPVSLRVASFVSGTLGWSASSLVPFSANGCQYEVWKTFSPWQIEAAINTVLTTRATYLVRQSAAMDKVVGYAVDAVAASVHAVERSDDGETFLPVNFNVRGSPGAFYVDLDGYTTSGLPANTTLYITYIRNYPALATQAAYNSTAETNCPEGLLVPWVCSEVYTTFFPRTQKADRDQIVQNVSIYEGQAQRYLNQFGMPATRPRIHITPRVSR